MQRGPNVMSVDKNSKLLLYLFVVLLVLLGATNVFSEELSRGRAAEMIAKAISSNPDFPSGLSYPFLDMSIMPFGDSSVSSLSETSVEPMLYVNRLNDWAPNDRQKERPASFLLSLRNGDGTEPYVGFARIEKVDVMELKKMSEGEYRAEFMVGYDLLNLGSILFGRGVQLERPADALFRFQDNGWRIQFIKRF
jgi:hypothetical protein